LFFRIITVAVSAPEKENTKEREELLFFDNSFLERVLIFLYHPLDVFRTCAL